MTLLWLDIFGTFAFALSGAFRAVKYELDVLGVLVLAIATGLGGGMLRDMLLGELPPAVFQQEMYFSVCALAGMAVFFWAPYIARQWPLVQIADGIGLGVFAAIGASKAELAGLGGLGIVMMAAITATGGGVIRDILVRELPLILHADFYASAVILGGIWFVLMRYWQVDESFTVYSTMVLVISLRMLALKYSLVLPKVKKLPESPSQLAKRKKTDNVK